MRNLEPCVSLMVDALKQCSGVWKMFDKIILIVNPQAGSLRKTSFVKSISRDLERFIGETQGDRSSSKREIQVHYTEYPGHAQEITKTALEKDREKNRRKTENPGSSRRILFISAGGDGNAQEISSALAKESRSVSSGRKSDGIGGNAVFRLPMGTGNDGLDAPTVASAFTILRGDLVISWEDGLEILPSNQSPLYSFNIVSLGLDGWVVHLSGKMKRFFPGSFYTVMVDVAALFYEIFLGIHPWEVIVQTKRDDKARRGKGKGGQKNSDNVIKGNFLLMACGVSGYRTYGGKKRILPNENNVCMVKTMGTRRKIAIKKSFYTGDHVELPEADLFQADEIEIRYGERIPLQYDGEVLWMEENDFPLVVRRVSSLLPRIAPKNEQSGEDSC